MIDPLMEISRGNGEQNFRIVMILVFVKINFLLDSICFIGRFILCTV